MTGRTHIVREYLSEIECFEPVIFFIFSFLLFKIFIFILMEFDWSNTNSSRISNVLSPTIPVITCLMYCTVNVTTVSQILYYLSKLCAGYFCFIKVFFCRIKCSLPSARGAVQLKNQHQLLDG